MWRIAQTQRGKMNRLLLLGAIVLFVFTWGFGEEVDATPAPISSEVQFEQLDWQAWDQATQSWFETIGIGEDGALFPPTPPEICISVGQPCQELPDFLCAVTNALSSVSVEGIQTWGISVSEEVAENGVRTLVTQNGEVTLHRALVPEDFNPEAWSLAVYNKGQPLPDWFMEDENLRTTWFLLRGRERLKMTYTFVEPGRLEELRRSLQARAEALHAEEVSSNTPREALTFVSMTAKGADDLTLEVHNAEGDAVGLLTKPELKDAWEYQGQLPMDDGQTLIPVTVGGRTHYPRRFFKVVNLTMDTDRDGLPDGLEVAYFQTDPEKVDTTDCGMDDWTKIYQYGLDPTIPDNDADGILDGEDETPLQAGPEICVDSPIEGATYSVLQDRKVAHVSVQGVILAAGDEKEGESRQLRELWINQVNQLEWNKTVSCEPAYSFNKTLSSKIGKQSVIIEVTQEGNPVLRSRKRINYTVQPLGPALHLIEPLDNATIAQSNVVIKVRVERQDVEVYCNGMQMNRNGYYRFIVFHFAEEDLNVEKIFTLKAVDSNARTTLKKLHLTMTVFQEKEIPLDHITNMGERVFVSPIDGITIGIEDED